MHLGAGAQTDEHPLHPLRRNPLDSSWQRLCKFSKHIPDDIMHSANMYVWALTSWGLWARPKSHDILVASAILLAAKVRNNFFLCLMEVVIKGYTLDMTKHQCPHTPERKKVSISRTLYCLHSAVFGHKIPHETWVNLSIWSSVKSLQELIPTFLLSFLHLSHNDDNVLL